MDIVLEFCDTFLFDRIYAYTHPHDRFHLINQYGGQNANFSVTSMNHDSFPKIAAAAQWKYEPASSYISFPPGEAAYLSKWSRDNIYRQAISLYFITWLLGAMIYFIFSSASYLLVFDKTTLNHPKFLKNQIRLEIKQAVRSMPIIAALTTPFFLAEVRGYSKLYELFSEEPFPYYNLIQYPLFLVFTDFCIYWIHRALHHSLIYKHLHKPHHKWIMPTPFASVAFHPLDGWAQSLPYHLFPFIFPLQKFAYLGLFSFVQIWTVMIHDGEYVANSPIINGAACHSLHHLYFNYNYGQYTTVWDRIAGSYRKPNNELFQKQEKMSQEEWRRQVEEMEVVVKEVEGTDDRCYLIDTAMTEKKTL